MTERDIPFVLNVPQRQPWWAFTTGACLSFILSFVLFAEIHSRNVTVAKKQDRLPAICAAPDHETNLLRDENSVSGISGEVIP